MGGLFLFNAARSVFVREFTDADYLLNMYYFNFHLSSVE